ncbi:L-tyrosine/L-tryptophan isonitrile synthase family protein [bacterium]|nr:L-tyrosine/L-tryptophan isonitrile synthase family protein [bacterium]
MRVISLKENISFKSTTTQKVAQNVADVILSYRRPFQGDTLTRSDYSYLSDNISKRILPSIDKSEPLQIAIVGFSLKSPNKKKVISDIADRAEYETLEHLQELTKNIKSVYPYGSNFRIFADGRIFVGTIFGSSDDAVTKYVSSNKDILKKQSQKEIQILSLDDFFEGTNEEKRVMLFSEFPTDKEKIRNMIKTNSFFRTYYQYMRDFYAKDIHSINPEISCKKSRQLGNEAAFGVICAAESYNQFINSLYKEPFLRLSVHSTPIYDTQGKIGIFLNRIKKNLPTPWHSAAVKITDKDGNAIFLYEKKARLEKAGCYFIPDTDGKGEYYLFPPDKKYDFSKSFKENLMSDFS